MINYVSPHVGEIEIQFHPCEREYVLNLLPENGTLVEWGCGGSTVFFLDNLKENQYLITIEHVEFWYDKISEKIKDHPNIDRHAFLFIPIKIQNTYYARPEEEMPCGTEDYIFFDKESIQNSDVFFIDGVSRGAVAAALRHQIKESSHVIIHDYKGREVWYDWAVKCYNYNATLSDDDSTLVHMFNIPKGD